MRVAAPVLVTGILLSWFALRAGAASHDTWVRDHGQVFTGTVTYPGLKPGATFDASPHVYVGDVEADVDLRGAIGEHQDGSLAEGQTLHLAADPDRPAHFVLVGVPVASPLSPSGLLVLLALVLVTWYGLIGAGLPPLRCVMAVRRAARSGLTTPAQVQNVDAAVGWSRTARLLHAAWGTRLGGLEVLTDDGRRVIIPVLGLYDGWAVRRVPADEGEGVRLVGDLEGAGWVVVVRDGPRSEGVTRRRLLWAYEPVVATLAS